MVAALLVEQLPPGSRLLDVGAGITPACPLPEQPGLPRRHRRPLDGAPDLAPGTGLERVGLPRLRAAGLAHRSVELRLEGLPAGLRFDGVYSVSVIEHVAAEDRRRLLSEMAARLRRGGVAVVTIDLVRGTSDLWNRNLGVEVESPERHGSFDDVVAEARRVGLDLVRRETVREWGDVDVDIGLLAFTKGSAPWLARVRRRIDRWRTGVRHGAS